MALWHQENNEQGRIGNPASDGMGEPMADQGGANNAPAKENNLVVGRARDSALTG